MTELAWVGDVLWGPSNWRAGEAEREPGRRQVERFAVLPSARHPRLLVPLGSRRAARRALLSYTSSKPAVRAATHALAVAAGIGLAPRLMTDRLVVTADGPSVLLQDHLKQALGRDDLHFAISFQTGRPQKKPVLQVLAEDGSVIAFAKVGWNDLSRRLVRREADTLLRMEGIPRPGAFTVGRVLHAGSWRGLELLVVEAAATSTWARRRLEAQLPLTATIEMARLEPTQHLPLAETRWWRDLRTQAVGVVQSLSPGPIGARIERLSEAIAASADVPLELGWAHGDWVPWNMGRLAGRLVVWDWERASRDAPVGLDAAQFLFQTELNLRRRRPDVAIRRVIAKGPPLLEQLGVSIERMPLLLGLHLLESVIRLEAGRAEGIGGVIPNDRYDAAIAAWLDARV